MAKLASELQSAFDDTPTIGCTTAGQLGFDGFTKGGLTVTAISLAGDIVAHAWWIRLLPRLNIKG